MLPEASNPPPVVATCCNLLQDRQTYTVHTFLDSSSQHSASQPLQPNRMHNCLAATASRQRCQCQTQRLTSNKSSQCIGKHAVLRQ